MNRFPLLELRRGADVMASNVDKKSVDGEIPVRLVNYVDVYYNDEVTPDLDLMPATATSDQVAKFHLKIGDTVITKDSETAEDIGVPTYVAAEAADVVCGYHLSIIRSRGAFDARFLNYAMRSKFVRGQLTARANGVTRFGLTYDAIRSVEVPCPDLDAQVEIAQFLDAQISSIRQMVPARTGVASTGLGLLADVSDDLQDYEQALIAEAVLGDYSVRGA